MVHVAVNKYDFEKINILEYAFGEGGGGHQKAYAVYAFINIDNCERPLSSLLQHHNSKLSILLLSAFLIVQDSQPYSTTGKTNAFTILHFVVIVISLSFHILFSPVIAALPNANRLKISPLHEPESSILAIRLLHNYSEAPPISVTVVSVACAVVLPLCCYPSNLL